MVTQLTPFHFGGSLPGSPAWDDPRVGAAFRSGERERFVLLWDDREMLLEAVEALPRTCSHLDAHRRNLFARGDEIVAIDWGLLGLAAPGEEIASTLVGTVASGEHPADDAAALASVLYDNYVDGLREAGWPGDEREVRLAFTAACGLRTFSILSLDAIEMLPWSAALARVLVDFGDEARSLGPALRRA